MKIATLAICLLVTGCKKSEDKKPDETDKPPAGRVKASLGGGRGSGPFTPSNQGFKFQNYANVDGIQNLTPAEVKRMFGSEACADDDGETCVLTPAAEQWMQETNKSMGGGHCEGMAALSLLFRVGKLSPKDFGAETAFDLKLEGNDQLQREIAYWFATQGVSPMSEAEIRTLTPNEVVERLTKSFANNDESWTIGIYMPDGSLGHATTPYAIVEASEREAWILHYDNNFPGEERKIVVDRVANTWTYFTSANPNEEGATYRGDAETRTLTIAPTSTRVGKLACPFCGDIDASEPVRGMRQISLDGDADLLITDDTGKRIGHAKGKLVNEIANAHVVRYKAKAGEPEHEPMYVVPAGKKLVATIDGAKLTAEQQTDISLVGPGYTMGVYGIELDPGAQDQITFSADWHEITYVTQSDATPDVELAIVTKDADYEFDVLAGAESGGVQIDIALDPRIGTFAVTARAKDGTATYEVEIRRLTEDGKVDVFQHDGVSSGPKDRFVFHYADWKGNADDIEVGVDRGGDGSIDDTEQLTDEE